MSAGDNRQLGSIRNATGMDPRWNRPQRAIDDGRPGYAWRDILGSATPRDDWAMVTEARPLTTHNTGGAYYDHEGTLEGTKPPLSALNGASWQTLQKWDFERTVNG